MRRTIGEVRRSLENCQYWTERNHKHRIGAYIKYAFEMFEFLIEPLNLWLCEEDRTEIPEISENILLNGACNWKQYSRDGNSLIFNRDICHRLCDYKDWDRFQDGRLTPNKNQDWLDAQAKALQQASRLLIRLANT